MASSNTKSKKSSKRSSARRKPVVRRNGKSYAQPYDAEKFAGTVPAFADVTAEEMKTWRDDR